MNVVNGNHKPPSCQHGVWAFAGSDAKRHEWGLGPLRLRRLPRVRLHVDLTILARLTCALANARAVPLAA
ncbi:MAG: hypothetical protein ACRDTH_15440 [Pseudonocardiaceae bacterium]